MVIFKKLVFPQVYVCVLLIAAAGIAVSNCQSGTKDPLNDPLIAEGKQLAQQHCGACHLTPSPDLLDKETWVKHVLPAMAPNLGLEVY